MKFNREINIESKKISLTSPTFIIAEAGVNHDGDMNITKQLTNLALDAGADAVKFQSLKQIN